MFTDIMLVLVRFISHGFTRIYTAIFQPRINTDVHGSIFSHGFTRIFTDLFSATDKHGYSRILC